MSGGVRFMPAGCGDEAGVVLLPQRCVYWPARRTLLAADLHLGKSEAYRSLGAPIPGGVLEADLARLDGALRATEARRLIVLGDLLHAPAGLTGELVAKVAAWRAGKPELEIVLVPGNHDKRVDAVAEPWRLDVRGGRLEEGPFVFCHDPVVAEEGGQGGYAWAGHLHPMVSLSGGGDHLRLGCFCLGERVGVLPAFSVFTSGVTVRPGAGDRVFAVAGERVVEV